MLLTKLQSSILNRIFKNHLEDTFKGMRGWDEDALEDAMEKFELTTKRKFGGDPAQLYSKFWLFANLC